MGDRVIIRISAETAQALRQGEPALSAHGRSYAGETVIRRALGLDPLPTPEARRRATQFEVSEATDVPRAT
jgi:hypothetical protein